MPEQALTDFYLGRQPILDRNNNLYAFELLFRSGHKNQADVVDNRAATASVISHAFGEVGLAKALGKYRGFINVDAQFLMSDAVEFLPSQIVVLEILETVRITPDLVARCRDLKELGFGLALDDISCLDDGRRGLLGMIDVVKVDIKEISEAELMTTTRELKAWPTKLLAEKIDNNAQANQCLELGYDYFQGYYYARPEIIPGKKLSPSELVLMRLMSLLLSDADTHEIEQVIKGSPTLTLNLLRIVNSVAAGLHQKVNSLRKAITLLGRRQLQRWVQLLLFAGDPADRNFPTPLLQMAAARGKLMELLIGKIRPSSNDQQDRAFMVGVMSLMPAVLNLSMSEILKSLPVDEEIRAALMAREGVLGDLIRCADALDCNTEDVVRAELGRQPLLSMGELSAAQVASLAWANSIGLTS